MKQIDFDDDQPVIWWTSYSRDALAVDTTNFPGDQSWKRDVITSQVVLTADRIVFDAPANWPKPGEPVEFTPAGAGLVSASSSNGLYEGVRAETEHAIVLTGNWRDGEYRGVFIAVLPKSAPA